MTVLEIAALKQFAKDLVDKDIPLLITAEEAKLPVAYAGIAKLLTDALLPQIEAMLDAKIAAL